MTSPRVFAFLFVLCQGSTALAQPAATPSPAPSPSPSPSPSSTPLSPEDEKLLREMEAGLPAPSPTPNPLASPPTSVAGAASNVYNPAMSLNGVFAGALTTEAAHEEETGVPLDEEEHEHGHAAGGAHDPQPNAFTLQNLELTMSANVDPYFRAQASLVFGLDFIEVEEAYVATTRLPFGLEARGGQLLTPFGRQNTQHPHAWMFADQNLVNVLLFGPDGLRNPGAQVSWLTPLPFYLELTGSVQDARGETAFSFLGEDEERTVDSAGEALYTGRASTFVGITDDLSVLMGVSGSTGPNPSSPDARTDIAGADVYVKYKPSSSRWFFLTFQAEAIARRYELPSTTRPAEDDGFYAQIAGRILPRWEAGVRVEGIRSDAFVDEEIPEWRARQSAQLSFRPSEFSKLRLQANHDTRAGEDEPVFTGILQVEFLIGAHGAHAF